MRQPPPGWYQDPANPTSQRRYWDGSSWTWATAPPPTRRNSTAIWDGVRRLSAIARRAIVRNPKLSAVGLIAMLLVFVAAITPQTPTPTPATLTEPPIGALPNVVGMTGNEGQQAIKTATNNRVFVSLHDAVPIGCTKLAQGDAPIIRTDPLAGVALTPISPSGIGGPLTTVLLYVDRSAGEPCDPPPPPPPPPPSPPGNTYIEIPDVPHHDDDHHGPGIFCRHTRLC
jgi:hypothetical protein